MSSDNLSKKMWQDYSEDEKGIILGIRPSPDENKDSIFNLLSLLSILRKDPFYLIAPKIF